MGVRLETYVQHRLVLKGAKGKDAHDHGRPKELSELKRRGALDRPLPSSTEWHRMDPVLLWLPGHSPNGWRHQPVARSDVLNSFFGAFLRTRDGC